MIENGHGFVSGPKGPHMKKEFEPLPDLPVYPCEKCAKKFHRKAALVRHMELEHEEPEDEEDVAAETEEKNSRQIVDEDYEPHSQSGNYCPYIWVSDWLLSIIIIIVSMTSINDSASDLFILY